MLKSGALEQSDIKIVAVEGTKDAVDIFGFYKDYAVRATVDANDATLSIIDRQSVFFIDGEDAVLEHMNLQGESMGSDMSGTIDMTSGVIVFPQEDVLAISVSAGYYIVASDNMLTPAGEPFDGIPVIMTEEATPAEFYDIRGIRVADPTPGQLVIRRQGQQARLTVF